MFQSLFGMARPVRGGFRAPGRVLCADGLALILGAGLVLAGMVGPAVAAQRPIDPTGIRGPVAAHYSVQSAQRLPVLAAEPVDVQAAREEDGRREAEGLPPRFALVQSVSVTPENSGTWEDLDGRFVLWRHRVTAPGALSLNFGFTAYRMPKGGRLSIYPIDAQDAADPRGVRVFTDGDNEDHGELWTPVVIGADVVIELLLPLESRHDYRLELTSVGRGYRFFGEDVAAELSDKSGACNIDVVCPEGDDWRAEIASVGVISTGGSTFCTGFMVNNTAQDATPYFMTANHCGINTGNAASLVVYWNFESPVCGQQGGGSLADFQTGSTFLASNSSSDFTLVRMDDPVDPLHNVGFAGWDNTSADAVQAIAIHHPNTDEKSISFEYDATTTTSYLGTTAPGDGTHVRITDWDLGTTEPGSSGSPLFDQNHHVIGQLHGGYAACGNDLSDWYGRFSRSWTYLAPYLDPLGTGATALDTYLPGQSGLRVTPSGAFAAQGEQGGPFTPAGQEYTLENLGGFDLSFSVTDDAAWLDVAGGSGTIPAGGTAAVTVSINAAAGLLAQGSYTGTVSFVNLTDGDGDTSRPVDLQVGIPDVVYSFPMDVDPGWTLGTGWGFGAPLGGGGQYGSPDPTAGHTGTNVVGYNLAGDYENSMPMRHVFSAPIDCSGLSAVSLRFWRWLGVESPAYDHAYVSVSNDGVNYTPIWSNDAQIADGAWTQVEYDISALADGRDSVTIAWTMGPTDASWQFCGWNIDDVEILGLTSAPDLTLTLTPHNAPIEIPAAGGQFTYGVTLQTAAAVSVDAVIEAVLPNGTVYPVLAPPTMSLAAGTHQWPNLAQDVPGFAPAGAYTYRCRVTTTDGNVASDEFTFVKTTLAKGGSPVNAWKLTGWDEPATPSGRTAGPVLGPATPNPFNPSTTIAYELPAPADVTLRVYDLSGRLVRVLLAGEAAGSGRHEAVWNGRDDADRQAAAGVYFYRLDAGGVSRTGRMVLVK